MKNKKRNLKLGLLFFVMLAMGATVFGWWQYRVRKWDGVTRFTIVTTDPLALESIDPLTGEGIRIKVPMQMEINTAGGRGKWRAEVLPQLAQKFGGEWLTDSVMWHFEVPVTASDRDWSLWDKWEWFRHSRRVKWEEVNMEETTWVVSLTAPDGAKGFGLSDRWKDAARRRLVSTGLAREKLNVRVVNAAGAEGLGLRIGNMIETAGMRVVMVASGEEVAGECEVQGGSGVKQSLGTLFLMRTFGCEWRESREENVGDGRLGLGEPVAAKWLGGD